MTLIQKLILLGYSEKDAKAIIMSGKVLVNEEVSLLGSLKLKNDDKLRIKESKKWVSRGAFKLLQAIKEFDLNINNKICLDVGASSGGFTQVLLNYGAKLVYALDSGTNQLDFRIRTNPKVISLEKTNLKSINSKMFDYKIDFISCDVSFISVKNLFNVLKKNQEILSINNRIFILIKPQFEANYNLVEKGGFVEEKHHQEIINSIINYAEKLNFKFIKLSKSPIVGNKSKNIEYLSLFKLEREKNE